ncbi:MAG TPA: glycerophosphodiester phosphodiesterase [Longimicrobiales bacterium]
MDLDQARVGLRCHPVLAGGPHLIAHRGGAGLAPENTLAAFRQAVEVWEADLIELDVHASADGHCVVIHDPTVDRTTDGTGAVAELTLDELRRLDAGYRFTLDGCTYPFRGQGFTVPTIDEVLEALPETRFVVEVKVAAAQRPLFEAIRRAGAEDRVIVAAESESARTLFGTYRGPKSASAAQLRRFYLLHRLRLARFWKLGVDAAQVPEWWGGTRVVSPRFIRDLHAQGIPVHVWTVNETEDMHRLLDWGVDGIVTDRPDRLAQVLCERVGRRRPPGLDRA